MPRTIRSLVVGIATPDDDPVLPAAVALARRLGAVLHVVHTYELPQPVLAAYAGAGWVEPEIIERYGQSLQQSLEAQVERLADGHAVHTRAVYGAASRILCEVAQEVGADLLIVGATRQGPMLRHILGSTAERVVRGSHVPVLVLRPPFEVSAARVLLTTDLSALSAAAVARGVELTDGLVRDASPELRCVLVTWYSAALPPPLEREQLEEVARSELARFLRESGLEARNVEGRVRIGDPPKEIVTESVDWGADLLVLGTHGRTGVSRYFLGSVAASVLRSALCNVLVIPAAAVEGEGEAASPAAGEAASVPAA